jgi:hypothetical protein
VLIISKASTVGIVAVALAAPGATTATLTAPPAQADPVQSACSGPADFGTHDCQDPYGQGFICGGHGLTCGPPIDASQLPANPDPGNWGRGLPGSTDPRFIGPPGDDNAFLANMARANIVSPNGPQVLIQAAHVICSGLAQGVSYDQEATAVLNTATHLTRGNAIALVEGAHEFYCPTL